MENKYQQPNWRARALEMRTLGDQMHDQVAKKEILQLAGKYERLADWKDERVRLG
jgi:hypothetical protein